VINRRERSNFVPSNVTEVRRRFDRILKTASLKAEKEMKAPLASIKPSVPSPAATWRRSPRSNRRPA